MKCFWRAVLATTVVLSLLLFAAACGGNGDDNDDGADEPTAEATEADATDEDGGNGNGDATDAGDGGDASQSLRDLAGNFADQEVRAVYQYTATGADAGTFTLYWKPPDWRLDISSGGSETSLITKDAASYICSADQCIESPAGSAAPLPFLTYFTDPDSFGDLVDTSVAGVDVSESERTIAGQDARCFSYETDIGGSSSSEYCFSEDGALLLLSTSAAGSEFSIEATEFETAVSDADLELPYPVMSFP